MAKTSLRRETAQALADALGVGDQPPIVLTVITTALAGLNNTHRDDLIKFLNETRPLCTCGAAREPDYSNGDHDDACPAKRLPLKANYETCPACRYGDCFDPAHGW